MKAQKVHFAKPSNGDGCAGVVAHIAVNEEETIQVSQPHMAADMTPHLVG